MLTIGLNCLSAYLSLFVYVCYPIPPPSLSLSFVSLTLSLSVSLPSFCFVKELREPRLFVLGLSMFYLDQTHFLRTKLLFKNTQISCNMKKYENLCGNFWQIFLCYSLFTCLPFLNNPQNAALSPAWTLPQFYLLCISTSKLMRLCTWWKKYFFHHFLMFFIIFDHANECASMRSLVEIHNIYLLWITMCG